MLPPVRRFILVTLVVISLFLLRETLTSWANNTARSIWEFFGWGLVLIAIALGTIVGLIWRRKLASLIYHWNQWLSSIAFTLAVWGILARIGSGGSFGLNIIDYPIVTLTGIPRIVGLVIIGIILLAPGTCFRLTL